MSRYIPDELLPVIHTYKTLVKNGIEYKLYYETDWDQVITEDGISLSTLLKSLPPYKDNLYKYKGILQNTPAESAIDRLYSITNQEVGDVWLIETDLSVNCEKVYESYIWLNNAWVFCGTTNKKASISSSLPEVIQVFPDELGKPNQVMIVGKDGRSLSWGSSVEDHDKDPMAHTQLRNKINLKADKLIVYNDTLLKSKWVYNDSYPGFEYIYTHNNLQSIAYFEMTPIITSELESDLIASAKISPVYEIKNASNCSSYAILKAKHVPDIDIPICIKIFGSFINK